MFKYQLGQYVLLPYRQWSGRPMKGKVIARTEYLDRGSSYEVEWTGRDGLPTKNSFGEAAMTAMAEKKAAEAAPPARGTLLGKLTAELSIDASCAEATLDHLAGKLERVISLSSRLKHELAYTPFSHLYGGGAGGGGGGGAGGGGGGGAVS